MAKVNETTVTTDVKAQDSTVVSAPADQEAATAVGVDTAVPASATGVEGAAVVAETVEHPLDIISEIEHLLRIVGNVAVHEFRRISERLADLKNHPAIKVE